MTHIPDLAPYDYYGGAPEALAVGWLDLSAPFATGACPRDVLNRLVRLADEPVRLMRGVHYCQFCAAVAAPPRVIREDIRLYEPPDVPHGNGELWITAPDGTHFAAPTLITHYIEHHQYLPPASYLDAVRTGVPTLGVD